jgi:glycosyltransferase involved in cell wall biosynthesis
MSSRTVDAGTAAPVDLRTHVRRVLTRALLGVYLTTLRLLQRFAPRRQMRSRPQHILLTGTYQSHNWIRAHLGPLAASEACARITMVTTTSLPDIPKVVRVSPPRWLSTGVGAVPARLLTFVIAGVRLKPDIVGGFHLLVNGLVATWLARAIGARAWYFSVGGVTELRDGGVWGENPHFARLRVPDRVVERQLAQAVACDDLVITMGSSAVTELRARGVRTQFEIVPGGIEDVPPDRRETPQDFDLILVARLVPIKRIDLFLEVVATLRRRRPHVTAAIVGDGPLRQALVARASALGITDVVTFAGQQQDVRSWLRRARVFALTSRSEGLALSLMEAMMEGRPAVVPRIGDLADLVEHDRNGYLIDDHTPEQFADAILRLLESPRYIEFARAARTAGLRHTVAATTAVWDRILRRPELASTAERASAGGNAQDTVVG